MNRDLAETIEKEVKTLHEKKALPSTIGHYLRDKYNLKVTRLCKSFPFLSQKLELVYLKNKISVLKEHLKRNHKDFVTKRTLKKKLSKYYNLCKYYEHDISKN